MSAITEGWRLLKMLKDTGSGDAKLDPGRAVLEEAKKKVMDAGGTEEDGDLAAASVPARPVLNAIVSHPDCPELTKYKAQMLMEKGTVPEIPRSLSLEERAEMAATGIKAPPSPPPLPPPAAPKSRTPDASMIGPKKVKAS